jgi:hypothetical protein
MSKATITVEQAKAIFPDMGSMKDTYLTIKAQYPQLWEQTRAAVGNEAPLAVAVATALDELTRPA